VKNLKLIKNHCNRSLDGATQSFPHVLGDNPYFFRQMDAR